MVVAANCATERAGRNHVGTPLIITIRFLTYAVLIR